jgi:hypothetical protein
MLAQEGSYDLHYGIVTKGELQRCLKRQQRTVTRRVADLYNKFEDGAPIEEELRDLEKA